MTEDELLALFPPLDSPNKQLDPMDVEAAFLLTAYLDSALDNAPTPISSVSPGSRNTPIQSASQPDIVMGDKIATGSDTRNQFDQDRPDPKRQKTTANSAANITTTTTTPTRPNQQQDSNASNGGPGHLRQ